MIDIVSVVTLLMNNSIPQEDAKTLSCIMKEESNFNPKAINKTLNKNGTKDYGLFQINEIWLESCKETPEGLLEARRNIKCAAFIYHQQGLTAWSTYGTKCNG